MGFHALPWRAGILPNLGWKTGIRGASLYNPIQNVYILTLLKGIEISFKVFW